MRRRWCGIFSRGGWSRRVPVGSGGCGEPDARRARLDGAERTEAGAVAYRRRIRADFRGLTAQEYAESEESCFLASGESVFELAALEARLQTAPEPSSAERMGS